MKIPTLLTELEEGKFDARFEALYGAEKTAAQRERYRGAVEAFAALYGSDRDVCLFSVPGRSEISGNHTDHNRGCVIAAAVDLDIIAVAAPNGTGTVTVKSEGFPADSVSVCPGDPAPDRFYTSAALIEGLCAGFRQRGFAVCGFDAYTTSSVLKGSGISSSAAFEVMIGTILNHMANGGTIPAPVIAEIAQFAENRYFGKPSGLMDQTACAVGGFSFIDFADPAAAGIEKLDFDLNRAGYSLCITNTGGNHADLNEDYASVPAEMKAVAAAFGREYLRGLTVGELISRMKELRETVGDRALLRAYHFLRENERVGIQADALRRGDLETFFRGVLASGHSSFEWLQNVYTVKNVREQGLSLALAVTEAVLSGCRRTAAWRIHGGGFAGTIQAFVPQEDVPGYKEAMEEVFGLGSCAVLKIRREGAVRLL